MSLFDRLRHFDPAEREFASGAPIFRRGDEVSVLHLVVAGEAHLVRHRTDGGPLVLQRALPNAVLAEASVFSARYHCDGVAVAPTCTLAVPRSSVRTLLASDPGFAESFAHHLAHELQTTRLRAEILSLRTVAERLDAWITWHGGGAPPRGTWKTVASELGTSPEALYRELAKRRAPGTARSRPKRRK